MNRRDRHADSDWHQSILDPHSAKPLPTTPNDDSVPRWFKYALGACVCAIGAILLWG